MSGTHRCAEFLDDLKNMGFLYATKAGVTVAISDMIIPQEKHELIEASQKEVNKVQKQYERGVITNGERYNKIIDLWTHTTNEISEVLFDGLRDDREGFNPVYMMATLHAVRKSKSAVGRLARTDGQTAEENHRTGRRNHQSRIPQLRRGT
jgi:DNA-directed RNA polymerase subunit beta'